jgi:hypothetical protein
MICDLCHYEFRHPREQGNATVIFYIGTSEAGPSYLYPQPVQVKKRICAKCVDEQLKLYLLVDPLRDQSGTSTRGESPDGNED